MDDEEIFDRQIAIDVFEAIGRFVFDGMPPGSLAMALVAEQPFEVLRARAHTGLSDQVVRDTALVVARITPNVVKQNLSSWRGLWHETEARQMQWKLEAIEPTKSWEAKFKSRLKQTGWPNKPPYTYPTT